MFDPRRISPTAKRFLLASFVATFCLLFAFYWISHGTIMVSPELSPIEDRIIPDSRPPMLKKPLPEILPTPPPFEPPPLSPFVTVYLIENWNRTNVIPFEVPSNVTLTEFKKLATARIKMEPEMNQTLALNWWSSARNVSYLNSRAGTFDQIYKISPKFIWTKPNEVFRRTNGAFAYLWTDDQSKSAKDGNHDKTPMMKMSIDGMKNFFARHGPYPIIFFHSLPQDTIDWIEREFNQTTIIHWVNVSKHFPFQQLPDLPLLRSMNLTEPGVKGVQTKCSNRFWTTGYLQMIRFRVLGTWEEEIFSYFDYITQIDTDITILKADIDPFEKTAEMNSVLGFFHCEVDYTCAEGLHQWIQDWAKSNNVTWKWFDYVYHELVYSVNFATFDVKWFRDNPLIRKLMTDYVNTGYIETRRWTEQILYPYMLAMFAEFDQIYLYGDSIMLQHYWKVFPPRLNCFKKVFDCCA